MLPPLKAVSLCFSFFYPFMFFFSDFWYKKVLAHLQEVICVSFLQCGKPEAVCLW